MTNFGPGCNPAVACNTLPNLDMYSPRSVDKPSDTGQKHPTWGFADRSTGVYAKFTNP